MKPILPAAALSILVLAARLDAQEPGRLLRYPDVRGDTVVFVEGGDVWEAAVKGGPARRLTTHAGLELFPKISPDGRWIAFSAEYSGSRQVWVIPAHGGLPRQLTFYTDVGPMPPRGGWDYWIQGWTPDGKILVRANRTPFGERMGRYFVVDPNGGLETPLPLPEGGSASLSPDGKRLAYCPIDREFRTWKRTMGGRAQDVWIFDLVGLKSEKVTDWKGTDNFPMWWKDTIYFTSDRDRTLNVFAYDTRSRATRKVTSFTDFDVLWPSLGDGQIVFVHGGELWRLPLDTEKAERIPITLGADFAAAVPRFVDVKGNLDGFTVSPSGARALFAARGDLFSVPAKDGATRNLTRTQGVRELSPAWSPDGKWIVYLSDRTGEYEVWIRPADGSGEPRQVTKGGDVWRYDPLFSPDGRKLVLADQKRRLLVVDVATGEVTVADTSGEETIQGYSFSPDSRWLSYQKSHPTHLPGVWVYSLDQKKAFPLGDGLTSDVEPVFSRDGKYLFFLSNRDFNLTFSSYEFSYVYDKATRVYAAALTPGVPALFPPKSDEEGAPDEKKADDKKVDEKKADEKKADAKSKKEGEAGKEAARDEKKGPEPVSVVPEGFVARTVALPGLKADDFRDLQVGPDAVHYRKGDGAASSLWRYDLKDRKEEKVADGVRAYVLTADGKKLLYQAGPDFFLVDAKGGKGGEGKLDLSGLRMKLDPRAEWKQMWADAVRIGRDFFYDPKMHGFDWQALARKYEPLVGHVAHRSDLDFLLGELLSELEAGHTYVQAGDEPKLTRVPGGMLGCELAVDAASGRYRIAKIYAGESWDDAYRSPLAEPGVNVAEGELLLAIDGEELKASDNPYRLLEGKAGQQVVLTVGKEPAAARSARKVTVRPVESELNLRYLDWVKSRMAMVDRLSGGKLGYIHLPDTAVDGNRMLQKLFYSQSQKEGLIVDDRYNGGGFIPDRMIEMLSRKTLSWWARRDIRAFTSPGFAHDGPKAMLINGFSSSGGDALPYYFRKNHLGPLIGTRTWGGLIGLSGGPSLVDGGAVLIPSFRIYDENGRWVVENEGVSPDIEVIDLPEARIAGHDPSLEKAVEVLLKELEKGTSKDPKTPTPPSMGSGLKN